jgi:hypothetical protein
MAADTLEVQWQTKGRGRVQVLVVMGSMEGTWGRQHPIQLPCDFDALPAPCKVFTIHLQTLGYLQTTQGGPAC